jgi:RNA polymerase sigma-70 factor (ECF subfamily)
MICNEGFMGVLLAVHDIRRAAEEKVPGTSPRVVRPIRDGKGRETSMERPLPSSPSALDPALSDDDVVLRVVAGDRALYELLMRRYNQRLYRAVRAILRDDSEAEDVLQDAYLAAYRGLAEFRGSARVSTWLVRIAVNKALDRRRRRVPVLAFDADREARTMDGEVASASRSDDPERQSARREIAGLLEDAIDTLPDAFRTVYVLREIDGMSVEETAESLGLEANTVKTRLHRARALLRGRLVRDFDAAALEAFPFGAGRCDRLTDAVLRQLD